MTVISMHILVSDQEYETTNGPVHFSYGLNPLSPRVELKVGLFIEIRTIKK